MHYQTLDIQIKGDTNLPNVIHVDKTLFRQIISSMIKYSLQTTQFSDRVVLSMNAVTRDEAKLREIVFKV
jgi:hypothetical protein